MIVLRIFLYILLLLVSIGLWHFTTPESWRWLNDKQLTDLGYIILGFTGAIFYILWEMNQEKQ